MTSPPFKIGDRVVCVNARDTDLLTNGVYQIHDIEYGQGSWFVSISPDSLQCMISASRFVLEQYTPCPSLDDDYPDSVEDYSHNKPHAVIAWGAAALLMWMTFFAGLWMGWMWL